MSVHRVVIVGGGFGGLNAAQSLKRAPVDVTLIDRRNFHLFQPLLYQVATGGLSPANIASPLRALFRRHRNVEVLLGEVTDIDPENRLSSLWRLGMNSGSCQQPAEKDHESPGSHDVIKSRPNCGHKSRGA